MKCCNKPKFKLEKSEKLKVYNDSRHWQGKAVTSGQLINEEIQRYMIFCENCGHLERKGEI